MNIFTFKKCECGKEEPHGYFYMDGDCIWLPILSITAGKMLMERTRDLNDDQKSALEQEMVSAGLPEKRADNEDVLAVDEASEMLSLFARMMADAQPPQSVLIITPAGDPTLN
jgi:hypothetical protein